MKRLLLAIAIMMASVVAASAQTHSKENFELQPGLKYRDIKNVYHYQAYQKQDFDKHDPAWSGVASFFIPGLGQMINGEIGRGFAWLGGHVALAIVSSYAGVISLMGVIVDSPGLAYGSLSVATVSFCSLVALDVCSIVDAVRIAKVKNMYEYDLMKSYMTDTPVDISLYPSISRIPTATGTQSTAGFTLALNF